jgi:hypothetical protein
VSLQQLVDREGRSAEVFDDRRAVDLGCLIGGCLVTVLVPVGRHVVPAMTSTDLGTASDGLVVGRGPTGRPVDRSTGPSLLVTERSPLSGSLWW